VTKCLALLYRRFYSPSGKKASQNFGELQNVFMKLTPGLNITGLNFPEIFGLETNSSICFDV
jgi:hypothetical protein